MRDGVASTNPGHANTGSGAAPAGRTRLRILLYGQSLSGTGHFVRVWEIARALAARHEVHLVDGGRPVPRPRPAHPFALLPVPRICRIARRIVPVDPGADLDAVMKERLRAFRAALERIRPDVLVIEHFPFSKRGLREEIVPLIEHARAVRPGARVLASLRDIPPGSGDHPRAPSYREYVLETLHACFDGVLVHTDPALAPLDEHIPWADEIEVPVACTGYVSEKLGDRASPERGEVIVSTGGVPLPALVPRCAEAWQRLRAVGATGGRRLVVFLPPFGPAEASAPPSDDASIRFEPFTTDFLPRLAAADLSISQAGYNTCTNILETRTLSILVPNAAMSDQGPRARRLAKRGLARFLPAADLTAERLAAAIREALAGCRPAHDVDLQGADRTRSLIEQWCIEPRPRITGGICQP